MAKVTRRNFLQAIPGAMAVAGCPAALSEERVSTIHKFPSNEPGIIRRISEKETPIPGRSISIRWRNRCFYAVDEKLYWSKRGAYFITPDDDWIVLDTKDVCCALMVYDNEPFVLYWFGQHEVWRITPDYFGCTSHTQRHSGRSYIAILERGQIENRV